MRKGNVNILGNLEASKIDQLVDNILLNAFNIAINGSLTQHGIGSGTSMEYKITTHNNKNCKIHGVGELWD